MTQSYRSLRHARFATLAGLAAFAMTPLALGSASAQTPAQSGLPTAPAASPEISAIKIPAPRREFRGVWIATVDNIDWPSSRDLTTDQQKGELIHLLDRAKALKLNAILLQVRPACDALYASPIEPWSQYLTGQMGTAPSPAYDPLEFAVTEAHRRGMELHAWINPFRVRQAGDAKNWNPASSHISRTHPDWVRTYGKMLWLDPGLKEARDYSLSVVNDIVTRYDVDGVHMDDYFYPYKIEDAAKHIVDFPDDATFGPYQAGGGTLSRSDWRRANIDDFVARMYSGVKAIKPWVKVGISPFGIWRPGNPAQIEGLDSYEELYGDSRRWLHEGWVDYLSPQLYWPIAKTPQSFPVLLGWWMGENQKGRHIWPGLYTSLASGGARSKWPAEEIEYQILTTRGMSGKDAGTVHFSAQFLDRGDPAAAGTLTNLLSTTVYSDEALIPPSSWLTGPPSATPTIPALAAPTLSVQAVGPATGWIVSWTPTATPPAQWLVQWSISGVWNEAVIGGTETGYTIFLPPAAATTPPSTAKGRVAPPPNVVAVTPVDRTGAMGATGRTGLLREALFSAVRKAHPETRSQTCPPGRSDAAIPENPRSAGRADESTRRAS